MYNFNFYNPTHIVFGKDRINEIDKLVPSNAKVLVLYGGGSVKKFGTLDKVMAALGGREVLEFGGIEPNPSYTTLMKAVGFARENSIDFLMAVGGGSVIDGTKFVAAAIPFKGENPADILTAGFANPNLITEAVPFGVVLTLPATGSEMNNGAVISYGHAKLPFSNSLVFPKFSLLDPTLTYTLPAVQVANGIIDTFIHVTEQYLTFPVEARVQDRMAEGIMQTLIEIGPKTLAQPQDYDARANLVWSATSALNGMIGAGQPQDWVTHGIGHELTALFGIDHGQTLAIILPSLLNVHSQAKHAKLLQYAERVWNITEGKEAERIGAAIEKTRSFFESLGIKTHLSDYGIGTEDIDTVLEQLKAHGLMAMFAGQGITLEIARQILEGAL